MNLKQTAALLFAFAAVSSPAQLPACPGSSLHMTVTGLPDCVEVQNGEFPPFNADPRDYDVSDAYVRLQNACDGALVLEMLDCRHCGSGLPLTLDAGEAGAFIIDERSQDDVPLDQLSYETTFEWTLSEDSQMAKIVLVPEVYDCGAPYDPDPQARPSGPADDSACQTTATPGSSAAILAAMVVVLLGRRRRGTTSR